MFDNLRNMLNFDDLLFEKRNREYGAYQLRKRYNGVLIKSMIIATVLFSLAIILPFLITTGNEKVLTGGYAYVPVQMEDYKPPEDQIYVPPAAPPPPEKLQEIVKYIPPVIVDSIIPITSILPTADELENNPVYEDTDFTATGTGGDINGSGEDISTDEPFFIVEVMPQFKGGDINAFRAWVLRRTNYPQLAIEKKIEGRVLLTFIVEMDGTVSNVTVVKGVDPIIDVEAIKAIEASPKWTPGLQRGQPVRVRFSIPLDFVL
jgi:periplasmic protein TonB